MDVSGKDIRNRSSLLTFLVSVDFSIIFTGDDFLVGDFLVAFVVFELLCRLGMANDGR